MIGKRLGVRYFRRSLVERSKLADCFDPVGVEGRSMYELKWPAGAESKELVREVDRLRPLDVR